MIFVRFNIGRCDRKEECDICLEGISGISVSNVQSTAMRSRAVGLVIVSAELTTIEKTAQKHSSSD